MELSILNNGKQYAMQIATEHFFGGVKIEFHDGEIVLIRKDETFKPNVLVVIDHG